MSMKYPDAPAPLRPSRRRFVQGLALGGVAAGFGFARLPAFAIESARGDANRVLTGNEFDLSMASSMSISPARFEPQPSSTASCRRRCCAGAKATR
jgi:hypothetical protein